MVNRVVLVSSAVKEPFILRIIFLVPARMRPKSVARLIKPSPVAVELARLTVPVELGRLGVPVPRSAELFSVALAIPPVHDLAHKPSLVAKHAAISVKLSPAVLPFVQLLV
jgi:hypothetical protein